MGCPVVVLCRWMGEGALKCSLTLSPSDLPVSPMVGIGAVYLEAFIVIDDTCLAVFGVLVLGIT